jgi:hypothetical protein
MGLAPAVVTSGTFFSITYLLVIFFPLEWWQGGSCVAPCEEEYA